jgi:hypothetical protein
MSLIVLENLMGRKVDSIELYPAVKAFAFQDKQDWYVASIKLRYFL